MVFEPTAAAALHEASRSTFGYVRDVLGAVPAGQQVASRANFADPAALWFLLRGALARRGTIGGTLQAAESRRPVVAGPGFAEIGAAGPVGPDMTLSRTPLPFWAASS